MQLGLQVRVLCSICSFSLVLLIPLPTAAMLSMHNGLHCTDAQTQRVYRETNSEYREVRPAWQRLLASIVHLAFTYCG